MSEQLRRLSDALIGRFVVEREIGVGGAAHVYLGRDVKHDRQVAIKVLRQELGASVTAERFNREVRLLGQLRHPNIVTLIDSGEIDGNLFYVMPYVEGESLRDLMNRGPVPAPDAVRLLRDIVDALAYAHRQGIVHRDVKPENVLVDHRHALVTDFGIARATSPDASGDMARRLTAAGRTLGSPNYMAPEQVAGSADADHRADIYAFGVMAYELLAGRLPYEARNAATMLLAHLNETPVPLARTCPGVPASLAKVVMRCLEKDPASRCRSSDEILAEFERLAAPEVPGAARPVPRRTALIGATIGAVALVALGFGVWGVMAIRELQTDRWAHQVAAPRIRQLVAADSLYAAWALAHAVEAKRPGEDAIAELWPQVASPTNLFTDPPGADVAVRGPGDSAWVSLGTTPLPSAKFPRAVVRLRFTKAGLATFDSVVDWRTLPSTFRLRAAGAR